MSLYDTTSNGTAQNQKNDATLTIGPKTAIEGNLERLVIGPNQEWGQSVGLVFRDTTLVDGVLMKNETSSTPDREKFKLFSWEQLGFEEGADYTGDDAPERHAETFRKTSQFSLVAAVAHEAGEEPVSIPEFITWEKGGQKPSSSAKRIAKLLSNLGEATILTEDTTQNWLNNTASLRPELEGRRVLYLKQVKMGTKYEYFFPTFIDAATGTEITMNNLVAEAAAAPTATDGGAVAASPETAGVPENSGTDSGTESASDAIPTAVEEFITFVLGVELEDDGAILDELYHTMEVTDSLEPAVEAMGGEEAVLREINSRR